MVIAIACYLTRRLARRLSARRLNIIQMLSIGLLVLVAESSATAQFPGQLAGRRGRSVRVETTNFVIDAPDQRLANTVAREAERYRKELSQRWLGYEIKPWSERCPIQVKLDMHAGGETSFAFVSDGSGRATPLNWQMKIFGPPDRLVDAVLPHEITHTIFATHFGRPLPRWADEGACTTVEHESEKAKNHQMLLDFLNARPSRGIPFNRMFTMRRYPHDILPLYAQGHSLAKFLIMKSSHREFLDYLEEGMQNESRANDTTAWDRVTDQHYGYRDLSELQLAWLEWVRGGSVETQPVSIALANAEIDQDPPSVNSASLVSMQTPVQQPLARPERSQPNFSDAGTLDDNQPFVSTRVAAVPSQAGWYARQMETPDDDRVSANRKSLDTRQGRGQEQGQEQGRVDVQDSRVDVGTLWR